MRKGEDRLAVGMEKVEEEIVIHIGGRSGILGEYSEGSSVSL